LCCRQLVTEAARKGGGGLSVVLQCVTEAARKDSGVWALVDCPSGRPVGVQAHVTSI
jgi:hypothetical protein